MHSTKLLTKMKKNYNSKFFSFIAGVVDTADIRDYLCEFSKKFQTITMAYSGARGRLIYEKKPEVENLVSDSL